MKLIPLSLFGKDKGKYFVKVDDEDYDFLMQWHWRYENTGYASRNKYLGGGSKNPKSTGIRMHRLIMKVTDPLIQVDHIDGDRLNNQKINLRIANNQQNSFNSKKTTSKTTSEYKGVCLFAKMKNPKWRATIMFNRRSIHIGLFESEIDAAIAYNEAAKKYFGDYALLNVILESGGVNHPAFV